MRDALRRLTAALDDVLSLTDRAVCVRFGHVWDAANCYPPACTRCGRCTL